MSCDSKLATTYCVYRITNTVNGKVYIGQSKNIKNRFGAHKSDLRCGTHVNKHLCRAWSKYGRECFEFEVLHSGVPANEVCQLEQQEIDRHNSLNSDYGYNKAIVSGLGYGLPRSEQSKQRQRESRKSAGLSREYVYGAHVGSITTICRILGVKDKTISNYMIRKGLDFQTAVELALKNAQMVGEDCDIKSYISISGETKRLFEWVAIYPMSPTSFKFRASHGWEVQDFEEFCAGDDEVKAYISDKVHATNNGRAYKVFDFVGSKNAICEFFGIPRTSLERRISKGLSVEDACLELIKSKTSTLGTIDMQKFSSVDAALRYMRTCYAEHLHNTSS